MEIDRYEGRFEGGRILMHAGAESRFAKVEVWDNGYVLGRVVVSDSPHTTGEVHCFVHGMSWVHTYSGTQEHVIQMVSGTLLSSARALLAHAA